MWKGVCSAALSAGRSLAKPTSIPSRSARTIRPLRPTKKGESVINDANGLDSVPGDFHIGDGEDTKEMLAKSWNWVPPRSQQIDSDDAAATISVKRGELLTTDEVIYALKALGGEDITTVNVKGRMDTIENFIFVTGRSSRHLVKMSEALVKALKARKLKKAPGVTGYEGSREDHWHVVDCYNLAVHVMLPDTRRAMDLEKHWAAETRPIVIEHLKDRDYEEGFEQIILEHPPPEDYNVMEEDRNAPKEDKKKDKKGYRVFPT